MAVNGCIRRLGRTADLALALRGVAVTLYETLPGLEVKVEGTRFSLLRNYQTYRQVPTSVRHKLPAGFYCEQYHEVTVRELLSQRNSNRVHTLALLSHFNAR